MSDPALKNPLSINLPTQAVLGLLREHPEVEMTLLKLVSDRVATALVSKSEKMSKERVSGIILKAIHNAEKDFAKDYTLSSKNKEEIKFAIDRKVEISGTTFFRARSVEFKKELRTYFEEQKTAMIEILQKELNTSFHEVSDKLEERVRKMAREEFFSVLEEARAVKS